MKFATDKVQHGYLPSYLRIAAELGPAARVCEVGVQHGHGLDMFQALFPDGLVAGVDVNAGSRWPDGTVAVIAAQDDPSLPALLGELQPGSGTCSSTTRPTTGTCTIATMRLLWPLLAPGGSTSSRTGWSASAGPGSTTRCCSPPRGC